MRLALFLLLTGCVPTLHDYAQHTCSLSHAEWTGDGMLDPNGRALEWPVCIAGSVRFIVPPQNPEGGE